jgi:membrane protein
MSDLADAPPGPRSVQHAQRGGSAIHPQRSEGASPQLGQRPHRAVRRAARQGAELVWRDSRLKDLYHSGKEFELMARAMGFAALAMLTVIPLLIVVAAASAATHLGLADWMVYGMGLTRSSALAVAQLFSAPGRVLSTTSVFSTLLLGLFGVTFAGSVQTGFERVWGLPAGPWHKIWRQAVWLAALIAYIYAAAEVASVTRHAPAETVSRVSAAVVLGIVFFWWGLRFLVGGRVSYLAALPGAVATVAFLAGLRAFSALVFQPLITTNAVSYGAMGTVLIVQSWLVGVGWVIYGSQLFGRWCHDGWLKAWADSRRGHGQPGGGEERSGARRPKHTA